MVEPSRDAPDSVRRIAQEGKLCVMFYGPAANKVTLAFQHLLTQKESARALCTPLCHAIKARYPTDEPGLVSGSCHAWCSLISEGSARNDCAQTSNSPFCSRAIGPLGHGQYRALHVFGDLSCHVSLSPAPLAPILLGKDPCFVLEISMDGCLEAVQYIRHLSSPMKIR